MALASALAFTLGTQEFTPLEKDYTIFHSQTPHAWVATNLYAHEILLLDPKDSPLLCNYYEQGKKLFLQAAAQSIPSLLSVIGYFLHTNIFTHSMDRKQATQEFIRSWGHPCIPLEAFIKNRTGVCRHFVLTAAYILTRLQTELNAPLVLQKIQIVRKNLTNKDIKGRHAWLEIDHWHFDPYWNLIGDLADPQQKEFIYQFYDTAED